MVEGRNRTQLSADLTFCQQQQCLSQIQTSVEGDTKKLQNPYPKGCLPWATWIDRARAWWLVWLYFW
ncbi:hypothetical protein [Nostoc sp.]|uniref:hypothetical protein n=1 Tax=Nostoc sp. TaxID=1180 RepID=UPI002FFC84C6